MYTCICTDRERGREPETNRLPTKRYYIYTYIHTDTYVYLYTYMLIYREREYVCDSLHRIEFGPSKFFSKTFKFSIIFHSTWQIFGGGHFRKACRSRKKESKPSEITCKQSEPARTISKIEKRREFVRALCYEHSR